MKQKTFYLYHFNDGYEYYATKKTKSELLVDIYRHGSLLYRVPLK